MQMMETHPFKNLGPAPYRYIGLAVMPPKESRNFNETTNHLAKHWQIRMGSCAHCGTGIFDHYVIRDGDGKHHAIGSTCIGKLARHTRLISQAVHDAKKAIRLHTAQLRAAREAIKLDALSALMSDPDIEARLIIRPHSRGFMNRETRAPLTAWDEAQWLYCNAGTKGKLGLLARLTRI